MLAKLRNWEFIRSVFFLLFLPFLLYLLFYEALLTLNTKSDVMIIITGVQNYLRGIQKNE